MRRGGVSKKIARRSVPKKTKDFKRRINSAIKKIAS